VDFELTSPRKTKISLKAPSNFWGSFLLSEPHRYDCMQTMQKGSIIEWKTGWFASSRPDWGAARIPERDGASGCMFRKIR
jgi:hypothetical protein